MVWLWNRTVSRARRPKLVVALMLGLLVADGQIINTPVTIAESKRCEHIALLGKTGTGKSSLLRFMAGQDIERGHGFCFLDLHGDATPVILSLLAEQESATGEDLSGKVILIEPGDPEFSVGLNILESEHPGQHFQQIAEFAAILKQRWQLDSLGARTEELLRNSLEALMENQWTLLELSRFLTDGAFRAACVAKTSNPEVREYFGSRYDRASEGMQAVYRDAILNKVSTFTADPRFRHLLGQRQSTFSLLEAIDNGHWILLNLDKGRLGEQATTLGSLFLARLKNALFARRSRKLLTLYCDEVQNLVEYTSGLESLLSESRKFGVGIVSANQFLDQYPAQMRAAILAVGTHVLFQLASQDAARMAPALGGGRSLSELLKNLPQRHMVIKSGDRRAIHAVVPQTAIPDQDSKNLRQRCRDRWARRRADIERQISTRTIAFVAAGEGGLDDWT